MIFLHKGIWLIYYFIYISILSQKAILFFTVDSPISLYYFILYSFDVSFYIPFFLNFVQIIVNILICIPLLLFILRIRFLSPKFWQHVLIVRLILDIVGHSYAVNELQSFYFMNNRIGIIVFLATIAIYTPSYLACFLYAFRQEELLKKKKPTKK